MIRTGGLLELFGEALLAFTLGRWFATTFFEFLWSSISAGALILIVVVCACLWMAWTAEDLIASRTQMEGWQLKSHLFILGGGFAFGGLCSFIHWLAYTAFPWIEAYL